jgi:DNA helicase-2/ATP-dependent DNA helicase PcrA
MELTSFAMEEERRLCYVGLTRAKEKLYILNASSRALFGEPAMNRASRFIEEIPKELIDDERGAAPAIQQPKKSWDFEREADEPKKTYASAQGFGVIKPFVKPAAFATPPVTAGGVSAFAPFTRVRHAKFGGGIVLEVSGSGASATVTVDFDNGGVKRFAAAYAPLTAEE